MKELVEAESTLTVVSGLDGYTARLTAIQMKQLGRIPSLSTISSISRGGQIKQDIARAVNREGIIDLVRREAFSYCMS